MEGELVYHSVVLGSFHQLKERPLSDPHYSSDELRIYTRPASYVIPIYTVYDSKDFSPMAAIGSIPIQVTKRVGETMGNRCWIVTIELANKWYKDIEHFLKKVTIAEVKKCIEQAQLMIHDSRYATRRLLYVEFNTVQKDRFHNGNETDIHGYLVSFSNIIITKPGVVLDSRDIKPSVDISKTASDPIS